MVREYQISKIEEIEAQISDEIDMRYYQNFVQKFKRFEDFPEIEQAHNSEDFFVDNLSHE